MALRARLCTGHCQGLSGGPLSYRYSGRAALGIFTSAIIWCVSKLDLCERLLKNLCSLLAQWRVAAKMEAAA